MFKQIWVKLLTMTLLAGLLLPVSRPEVLRAAPIDYDSATAAGLSQAGREIMAAFPNAAALADLSPTGDTVPVTTTIQAAIDAAQAGDRVSIPAGTYVESLTINKSITLTGVSSVTTIIRAVEGQRVITITDNLVRLENLQVTGGQSDGGGGIWTNSSVQIFSCWILDNGADYGGGVFQGGTGRVDLTASRVERNHSGFHGGGIYAGGGAALTDTLVISNTAAGGGGGVMVWAGNASVTGGAFVGNSAQGDGGGLNANDSVTLRGTRFISNTASGGGGGLSQWSESQPADVIESIFEYNTAGNGSALRVRGGLNAVNDLFAANVGTGGALYLAGLSRDQMFLHVTIVSPDGDSGTGIYVETGTVGLTNTIVASYTTGIQQVTGTLSYDYDLFFGNGSDVECGWTCDSGWYNIYDSDPLFANPAAGDYHLREGSYAINSGADLGITRDLDGLLRPDPGAGIPDIGAYEFQPAGITGHVTAARDGSPVTNVAVTLYSDRSGTLADYVHTGGDNYYFFANVTPGTYYLEFSPDYGSGLMDEFYNDRSSLDVADAVVVTEGQVTVADVALDAYGMITGHVTAADSGAPLPDVAVEVYTSTAPGSYYVDSAQTDASGVYTVSDLAAGTYYLHFDPPIGDYAGEYYNDRAALAYADPVAVTLNTVQTADAALGRAGRLVGVVTAADTHLPLADVGVTLWTLNECGLCALHVGSQTTDASGAYTFTGLSSGVVYVDYYPNTDGASNDYLGEHYHNQPSGCGDAVTVTLGATTQVDEDLERGGQITGRVTAADGGAGLADVKVYRGGLLYATTDASGYYTLKGVRTGDYTLLFAPDKYGTSVAYAWQYYDQRSRESQADAIHVTAPEVKTVNQTLTRGGWITGKVSAGDTGEGLGSYFIAVYDEDHAYVSSDVDAYGSTDASGVYTTGVLPAGAYFIEFQSLSYSPEYLDEYYNGKFSLLTDVHDLAAADLINVTNGNATTINASLTRGGHITGRLTAADTGLPLEDIFARVYRASDGVQLYSLAAGFTDATGVYTTGALPSSSYKLQFVSLVDIEESLAPYVSAQFYPTVGNITAATPVAVTAPNNATADDVIQLGGHISGRVVTADTGQPSPNVGVYVQSATDAAASTIAYTTTALNGTYLTPGLWPGDYKVRFRKGTTCGEVSQYYYLKSSWATADLVPVTAPNVTPHITGVIGLGGGDWTTPVLAPVTPGSGGTLVYIGRHGTVYTIEAPSSAVTEDLDLVLTPIPDPTEAPLSGMGYAGEVFDLALYRNGQIVSGVSFQTAISVTIHYVNADMVGRNESTFELYRWVTDHWETVGTQTGENQTLDVADNLLVAHLMGLSRFSGQAALPGAVHWIYLPVVMKL